MNRPISRRSPLDRPASLDRPHTHPYHRHRVWDSILVNDSSWPAVAVNSQLVRRSDNSIKLPLDSGTPAMYEYLVSRCILCLCRSVLSYPQTLHYCASEIELSLDGRGSLTSRATPTPGRKEGPIQTPSPGSPVSNAQVVCHQCSARACFPTSAPSTDVPTQPTNQPTSNRHPKRPWAAGPTRPHSFRNRIERE